MFTVVDLCDPNPCQNGGMCTSMGNTFTCVCPPEFTGTICDNGELSFITIYSLLLYAPL